MTLIQALRIYGPATVSQLAEVLDRRDLVQLGAELWCLDARDLAFPRLSRDETMWDLTPLGEHEFKRECRRIKDQSRLCQGVAAC